MAQRVEVPAAKPEDLPSSCRVHMVEREIQLLQVVSDLQMHATHTCIAYAGAHSYKHTYTNETPKPLN